jgi:hypothetical protein
MGELNGAFILVKLGSGQRSFITNSVSFPWKFSLKTREEIRDCIDGAIDLTADHVPFERTKRESGAVFE